MLSQQLSEFGEVTLIIGNVPLQELETVQFVLVFVLRVDSVNLFMC